MNDERAKEVVLALRQAADSTATTWAHDAALRDAADEIERLRAALEPFARAWNEQEPDDGEGDALEMHVKPPDCRRAAEVLK